MKTAIIIDSTAYANKEIIDHPDIYELKFTTTFEDGFELIDSSDLEVIEKFYTKLQESSILPTTSQPSPGQYIEAMEEIIEKGYDQLICIHLSAGLSGAYQTAKMVTESYKEKIKTKVIDSKGASVVIEALINQALEMLEKELEFEEICKKLTWVANNSMIYLTVSDLDNLVKGGRLNPSAAKIGNLLKIKPLLCIGNDGKIQLFERIRTDKRINQRLAQIAEQAVAEYPNGIILGFAHSMDEKGMKAAIEAVTKALPMYKARTAILGPVIGTHTGVGAIGMGITPRASY